MGRTCVYWITGVFIDDCKYHPRFYYMHAHQDPELESVLGPYMHSIPPLPQELLPLNLVNSMVAPT